MPAFFCKFHGEVGPNKVHNPKKASEWEGGTVNVPVTELSVGDPAERRPMAIGDTVYLWVHDAQEGSHGTGLTAKAQVAHIREGGDTPDNRKYGNGDGEKREYEESIDIEIKDVELLYPRIRFRTFDDAKKNNTLQSAVSKKINGHRVTIFIPDAEIGAWESDYRLLMEQKRLEILNYERLSQHEPSQPQGGRLGEPPLAGGTPFLESSGLSPYCKQQVQRMVDTAIRTAANSNGQETTVTLKNKEIGFEAEEMVLYVEALLKQQDFLCALTGYRFVDDELNPFLTMSLDRKNSALGYVKDNLQIVTRAANFFKGASDDDEWNLKRSALLSMADTLRLRG